LLKPAVDLSYALTLMPVARYS